MLLTFVKGCSDSKEITKLRKELEVVNTRMEKFATKEEVEIISNKTMFNFLIYEEDIDLKKASLSDIKNKVDDLQKKLEAK